MRTRTRPTATRPGTATVARPAALLLAAALALAGCAADGEGTSAGDDEPDAAQADDSDAWDDLDDDEFPESEFTEQWEQPSHVVVEVEGAVAFTWEGTQTLLTTRFDPPGASTNVFSTGIRHYLRIAETDTGFRWAVDMLGQYAGPGRYELDSQADSQGRTSIVFLNHRRILEPADGDDASEPDFETVEFKRIAQTCVFEIAEGERAGSLHCPELADATGATISLRVTWEPLP